MIQLTEKTILTVRTNTVHKSNKTKPNISEKLKSFN